MRTLLGYALAFGLVILWWKWILLVAAIVTALIYLYHVFVTTPTKTPDRAHGPRDWEAT